MPPPKKQKPNPENNTTKKLQAWLTKIDPTGETVNPPNVRIGYTALKGTGVFATERISSGDVVFRVPKSVCFGVGEGSAEVDSQVDVVRRLVDEREGEVWRDRLAGLVKEAEEGECRVAFCWSSAQRALLQGTELSRVVTAKLSRMRTEHEAARLGDGTMMKDRVEFEEYRQLCGVVGSHVNPWWER